MNTAFSFFFITDFFLPLALGICHWRSGKRLWRAPTFSLCRKNPDITTSTLEVGDRVLVRQVRLRGKHKLADKWEPSIYVVVRCARDVPVYTVKPEIKDGPLRTLHCDLLFPCGFLPISEPEKPVQPKLVQKPRTCQNPGVGSDIDVTYSDSEEDYPVHWVKAPVLTSASVKDKGKKT